MDEPSAEEIKAALDVLRRIQSNTSLRREAQRDVFDIEGLQAIARREGFSGSTRALEHALLQALRWRWVQAMLKA